MNKHVSHAHCKSSRNGVIFNCAFSEFSFSGKNEAIIEAPCQLSRLIWGSVTWVSHYTH